MGKFQRHLGALMRKNFLLKRRHPCSLLCELLLAISATGLLVMARSLVDVHSAVRKLPTQMLVERSMPVRLPECASYINECAATIMKDKGHSPMCIKGATYGCKEAPNGGAPGVWVSMGCNGTFDLGPGVAPLHCKSGPMGKLHICHSYYEEKSKDAAPRDLRGGGLLEKLGKVTGHHGHHGQGHLGGKPMDQAALLGGLMSTPGTTGMRRFAARFAIAGAGRHEFRRWLRRTGHPWANSVKLFKSAAAMQAHVADSSYPQLDFKSNRTTSLCGAVLFETPPEAQKVRYTLRFNTTLSPDPMLPPLAGLMRSTRIKTDELVDSSGQGKIPGMYDPSGITWYTQSGFLAMQRSVDTFLEEVAVSQHKARQLLRKSQSPSIAGGGGAGLLGEDWRPHIVVPFPLPGRQQDIFAMLMPNLLAPFLLISLTYSVNRMITSVVHEREARLRDGMRMMGMHQASFYMSWTITYMLIYLFVCSGVVLCLTAGRILPNSSASLLFVWLILFAAASISYGLLISTFFSKAKTAATVGSVVFYASSYASKLATPSSSPQFLRALQLLPPVSFELIAKSIANIESQGVGICWGNAHEPFQHVSVLGGCAMLAFDTVALFLVFMYCDQVVPHDIGVHRPLYFLLLPSFWREMCGAGSSAGELAVADARDVEMSESSALVEKEDGEAAAMMARSRQTVELRGLCKTYGELQAVRNLDLVMYQGEIFALLGHNGAGKTTTLGMLCGLMPPTRGSCEVFGHDLASERPEIQKLLGVCPQHDVLWNELTGQEHLTLFARFKGVAAANVKDEVSSMLQRVGLQGAVNTMAAALSGGMKRKLSLGIAFLGGSRLVVLDEPTSGLDPYSRRMVWELLRAMKPGRVTVLSTHYMDEADILGDRIAILHEGSLRCCGTPQFLKRAYDCGYNVTLVKRPGCETESVREALICNMPELASEVVTLSDSGNELMLQVPFVAARHFPRVLGGLEQNMARLCVESYGISVTTLEEVFLKVASGERVERTSAAPREVTNDEYTAMSDTDDGNTRIAASETTHANGDEGVYKTELVGCRRYAVHMRALLQKRFRYGIRDRRGLFCQLFLPTGTLLMLLAIISRVFFHSMPALELNVAHYNSHCDSDIQNRVDFTHLASVEADSATDLLEPGKRFWSGDLRRHPPRPVAKHDIVIEESLMSTIPGLAHMLKPAVIKTLHRKPHLKPDIMKALKQQPNMEAQIKELLRAQKGRRLAAESIEETAALGLVASQAWDIFTGIWASSLRVGSEAEGWAHFPAENGAVSWHTSAIAFAGRVARRLSGEETTNGSDDPTSASASEDDPTDEDDPTSDLEDDIMKDDKFSIETPPPSDFGDDLITDREGEPNSEGLKDREESMIPQDGPISDREEEPKSEGLKEKFAQQLQQLQHKNPQELEDELKSKLPKDLQSKLPSFEELKGMLPANKELRSKLPKDMQHKVPSLEEKLRSMLPKAVQLRMPQLQKQLENKIAQQLPALKELGHNVSAGLGLPDIDLEALKNLQEIKHLNDMDLGAELMGAFKEMPTWKVCGNVPGALKFFWSVADRRGHGYITRKDLARALEHFMKHLTKFGRQQRVMQNLITEVLFNLIDQDHDGRISRREFCVFGAALRKEFDHYLGLATHFSSQLLQSSAPCTRYGAYYVLRGPRNASTKWQTGADAALFVNTSSSHAAPVFQAALTNARFSRLGFDKEVEVNTHPFPQTQSEEQNLERIVVFFLSMYITFSLSFIPSGIAHFVVKEKETGARQLQVLSGVSNNCYWVTNLIVDMVLYAVPAMSIPIALKVCGFSMLLEGDCGQALLAVIFALGPALAGFTYIICFLFKDHSKAANMILTFCLVGATVLSTILFILGAINYNPMAVYPSACETPIEGFPDGTCLSPSARTVDKILGPIFRLVPTVCVYQALFSIAAVANLRKIVPEEAAEALMAAAGSNAPHVSFSPWAFEWAGEPLIYLTVEAFAYLVIVILLDICLNSPRLSRFLDAAACMSRLRVWRARRSARASPIADADAHMLGNVGDDAADDSVELERERVSFLQVQEVALHVECLEKTYCKWLALHAPPKKAVRGLSLAVHTGEVFGFLGHNGAGKTSAIKCIIGELSCTAGAVHVGGFDMERQVTQARQQIGYCPQFDALLELLTVRDHLEFYSALKGLSAGAVAQAQKDFGLVKNGHCRADVLSGGNKRKLSAAIALLGRPRLAILDEPSCGLDPAARRALWDAIHSAVNGSMLQGSKPCAVMLTTHSMEEAEALSTRLGILAEGKLLTVGTSQQIKQRHGSCHELCLTLKAESAEVLSSTLHHLGSGQLRPNSPLEMRSLVPLLDADGWKKRAYARPRCVVRAQLEAVGHVEAAVLAEWWLQQARGEAVENFLKALLSEAVELAENFGPYWRFRLPHSAHVGLPELFGQLEEHGKGLGIAEYTLTQATLEQIFNSMAQDVDAERQAAATA